MGQESRGASEVENWQNESPPQTICGVNRLALVTGEDLHWCYKEYSRG